MRILHEAWSPRNWLTSLLAPALAATALLGLPMAASAQATPQTTNTGPTIVRVDDEDCAETPPVVSVFVSNWDTSALEITRTSAPNAGKKTLQVPASPNATVNFLISDIGGDGAYTVGRQGHATPTPKAFTVSCPQGLLLGDIQLCNGTHVDGGTIGATLAATTTKAATTQNNSFSAEVRPGNYDEQATSPANYHFVSCNGFTGSGATATIGGIVVPLNGTGRAIFYVVANATIPTSTPPPGGGVPGGSKCGRGVAAGAGVLAAGVTM